MKQVKKENLLVIFVKAPVPGKVKTRMQPALTPAEACALYRAMGLDIVSNISAESDFDIEVHFWPQDAAAEIRNWLKVEHPLRPQPEGDLGKKMMSTFESAHQTGYRRCIIIGSDLPNIHTQRIADAFAALHQCDLVLGPTTDGGYYLIGMSRPLPGLFNDVIWSTETVFDQTMRNAAAQHITTHLLPIETDIDSIDEIKTIWQHRSHLKTQIPHTIAALSALKPKM